MKKLLTLLTTVALFVSCSNEENPLSSENQEVLFTTGVSLTKSLTESNQIASGQQVGVFLSENAASPGTTYEQNLLYTADGDGNLSGTTQYFPPSGNGLKISAYHPYTAVQVNGLFAVNTDQTTASGIYISDLLYCEEFAQSNTAAPVVLNFKHKLSLITYTLKAGSGSPDLTGATVSIVNANTAVEFDLFTGELGDISRVQDVQMSSDGGIIVPQTIASGTKFLKIILPSGAELFYTTPSSLTLESGKKYNFELEVNLNQVLTLSSYVQDWESGLDFTGGAQEEVSTGKLLPYEINYDGNMKYVFTYNSMNQVSMVEFYEIGTSTPATGYVHQTKYELTYDENGLLKAVYGDRPWLIVSPSEGFSRDGSWVEDLTLQYDVAGQVTVKQDFIKYGETSNYTTVYILDENGRVTSITDSSSTSSISDFFEYDENNNIIKTTRLNGTSEYVNGRYEYDNKNSIFKNSKILPWFMHYFTGIIISGNNNIIASTNESGTIEYTYNQYDYPTSITKTYHVDGGDIVKTTTISYRNSQ